MAGGLWAGPFSRYQSRNGMVVRRGARIAGTKTRSGTPRTSADRPGSRAFHRHYPCRGCSGPNKRSAQDSKNCGCRNFVRFRVVPFVSVPSSQMDRYARWFWRLNSVVFYHGISTWRRPDARPVIPCVIAHARRPPCWFARWHSPHFRMGICKF